ncbi:MAG: hypothetical protein M2R45_01769 [Verrucomicrobia subdivision 3 bacterium]|nr:hypothetical protein [Limisphaerales bacterium]MCS1415876.1 hypothetical protein [Limisphaerales bacterium]
MKNPLRIKTALLLTLITAGGGCATITNKSTQPIRFSSEPEGAKVSINGISRGKTPTTVAVRRANETKIVKFELEGYLPVEVKLDTQISGTTAGNLLLGGLLGLAVDAVSGKGFSYSDDHVHVDLTPEPAN